MMRHILWVTLLLTQGAALLANSERSAATTHPTHNDLIYSTRLRIPYGNSVWTEQMVPAGASPLLIVYEQTPQCPRSPYLSVFVRLASTGQWQPTLLQNGLDHYSGSTIDAIEFRFQQPYYVSMTCAIKVFAATEAHPNFPQESLTGAVLHPGGFVQDLELAVPPSKKVTHFRVAIPSFCPNIDVLDAAVVTEGVKEPAQLVDAKSNTFSVNDGTGSRISKILVSLNGPTDQTCHIPIYTTLKAE